MCLLQGLWWLCTMLAVSVKHCAGTSLNPAAIAGMGMHVLHCRMMVAGCSVPDGHMNSSGLQGDECGDWR